MLTLQSSNQLCGIGGLASWVVGCHNGYGNHIDTIPPTRFLTLIEAQFYQSIVEASFAFGFLKISIALSLLRLSRGSWYNRILWALIGMPLSQSYRVMSPWLTEIDTRFYLFLHHLRLHYLPDVLQAHRRAMEPGTSTQVLQQGHIQKLWSLQCRSVSPVPWKTEVTLANALVS